MESKLRNLVIDAIFPRDCLGCGKEGTLWCESCEAIWWPPTFVERCPFCDQQSIGTCGRCRTDTFLDGLSVFVSYTNPVVREAIDQWKYVGDPHIKPVLQSWLQRAAPRLVPPRIDAVFAPVPLHIRKHRERGFDQAGEMADWCGEIFSRPVYDLLIRRAMTSSQAKHARAQRMLGQLDQAFVINPSVRDLPNTVVLCDDVFTSGSTMDAAARCLKEAGVEWVWGLVLAKGRVREK